ncbi:MAG TPA: RHS repeat-associated core domain-containing protein [Candidatus Polarisedimenticolaceae bacterium]|nr:RHS repeat-associated core domain-containing protein [Candidatus Polarisedimenticolaceae bacterium]
MGPRYLQSVTVAWVNGTATYGYNVDTTSYTDPVLRSASVPTGETTSYEYAPASGEPSYDLELKQLTLPTGSSIAYTYQDHQFYYPLRNTGQGVECTRVVTTKSVGSDTWSFTWPSGQPTDRTSVVTDPEGAMHKYTYTRYANTGTDRIWKAGLLEKTELVDGGTTLVEDDYTYTPQIISNDNVSEKSGYTEKAQVGLLTQRQTIRNPNNKTSKVTFGTYDKYGNPGWKQEYGYDGALYRKTTFNYAHSNATFENAHIVDRPTMIRTDDASGVKSAETDNVYDTATGGGTAFGNVHTSTVWTSANNIVTTFTYDAYGDLTQRQVSGGGVTRTTGYTFTRGTLDNLVEGGRTIFDRTIDLNSSLVTSEQNANGGTTYFTYDDWSRLTVIAPPSDPQTTISYSATNITVNRGVAQSTYDYDGFGRLLRSGTLVGGGVFNYDAVDYDSRGDVLRKYEPSHSPASPAYTGFSRDALGRPLTASNLDGTTTFTYTGDTATINDGISQRVVTYDAFGRIIQVNEGSYGTQYEYDVLDHLTKVRSLNGLGDRVFTWTAAGSLLSENHPETGLIQYGINGVGERSSKTTSDGQIESYTLDAEGRVTAIDRPGADNDVQLYYDGNPVPNHPAGYVYPSGFLTGMSDASGTTVWPTRDINGRVLTMENKRSGIVYASSMQYDSQGNLSRVDYPHTGGTSRSVVVYTNNEAGQVKTVTLNGQTIVSNVQYNPRLTPDKFVYGNGVTVNIPTSEYELNRPTAITTSGAKDTDGSSADESLTFSYNTRGQVSSILRNGFNETYGYEGDRGFLTSASYWNGTVNYGYDPNGNMTSRQSAAFTQLNFNVGYANNRIAGCGYSPSGYMQTCGGHTYTYFSNGKLKGADAAVDYQYDGKDRLSRTHIVSSNTALADMYVEPLGRLSRFEAVGGASLSPSMDWIYAAGQVIASVDYDAPCACQPKTCASENVTCGTISDGCGGSVYCGACGGGGGCTIGGGNNGFGSSGSAVFQRQDQGQQLGGSGPSFCNNTNLAVTYFTSVSFSSGQVFPLSLPAQDTVPSHVFYTMPLMFDSRALAPGLYHAAITITTSLGGAALQIPVTLQVDAAPPPQDSTSVTGQLRWYVADHRGSTNMVLDSAGKVVAKYEYFPFGEQRVGSACARNEGLYQGSLRDQTANLFDFGARHDTPQYDRFMVPDVAWPDLERPSEWNRYLYASNDPVNLIDIFGRRAVMVWSRNDLDRKINWGPIDTVKEELSIAAINPTLPANAQIGARVLGSLLNSLFPPTMRDALTGFDPAMMAVPLGGLVDGAGELGLKAARSASEEIGTTGLRELSFAQTTEAGQALAQVQLNRLAGNAFRDQIANSLRAEGREVVTEVYKNTPFGKRFIDIEVSLDGKVLGGIETKLGNSPYTAAQRAKDAWLLLVEHYQVTVVRGP